MFLWRFLARHRQELGVQGTVRGDDLTAFDLERVADVIGKIAREAVIRDAIDKPPVNEDERRAAVAEILSADPMPVPTDPVELRRELTDVRESTRR